jgi:hypothetical protein
LQREVDSPYEPDETSPVKGDVEEGEDSKTRFSERSESRISKFSSSPSFSCLLSESDEPSSRRATLRRARTQRQDFPSAARGGPTGSSFESVPARR